MNINDKKLIEEGKLYIEEDLNIHNEVEECFDINDFIDIVLKRKKIVLAIFVFLLGMTLFSTFFSVYKDKKIFEKRPIYIGIDFKIDYSSIENNHYYSKSGIHLDKSITDNLLKRDKVVDKFYEIEELAKYLEKSLEGNKEKNLLMKDPIYKMRFLNEVLLVNKKEDKGQSYTLGINIDKDKKIDLNKKIKESLQKKLYVTYISILDEEIKGDIQSKINKKLNKIENENIKLNEKLKIIEKRIKLVSKSIEKNRILGERGAIDYIQFANPILDSQRGLLKNEYEVTSNIIVGLEGILKNDPLNNILKLETSNYDREIGKRVEKSRHLMIFSAGMMLAFLVSILGAFVVEFIENYKKRER